MIVKCVCKSDPYGNKQGAEYQDKKYGKQMRAHTPADPKSGFTCRCTVCGRPK